jgi:hypothetical protein
MLAIENQVCSFELALKLKSLGFTKTAHFTWVRGKLDRIWLEPSDEFPSKPIVLDSAYAYTVAELMYLLKKYTNWEFIDLRDNQADYLAEIIINEINDGQIDPKDLKL